MRIDLNSRISPLEDSGASAKAGRGAPASASGARAEDSAELSRAQARVSQLTAAVSQLPEVRQEKVAALTQAIAQGRYPVTAEHTAMALAAAMQI